MLHLRWLRLFPDPWRGHPRFGNPAGQQLFQALAREKILPWLFLASLHPHDDAPAALALLMDLYEKERAACRMFPGLAVAYALVWDQPLEEAWPHPFVRRAALPLGKEPHTVRFRWLASCAVTKKWKLDPNLLGVQDLIFLVDSPLNLDQLKRAQSLPFHHSKAVARLFASVPYDKPRIYRDELIWPHAENYRLEVIADKGGICADQAYLASQAAKAHGVPSILFMGQGLGGDHAWVGVLEESNLWNLVARYREKQLPDGPHLESPDPPAYVRVGSGFPYQGPVPKRS